MARVVKGRSPYRQGGDRYEAFRPERRDLDRARRSSSTKELLRIMALAEKIGKSPLGGLAIEGAKGIANLVREKPPTLQEAAAARAAAIPTPEEQGKAAGEAQAEQFIQEALKQPAPAIKPLAPAIAEVRPGRLSVRRAPTPEQEDLALIAREDLAREKRQAELKARSEKLTSEMEVKKQLLDRMEKLPPKFKTRMRMALRSPVEVPRLLEAIRDKHARSPVIPSEEEFYDVMADYLRIMKGQAVPDIDADVARVAREAVVPETQVQAEREEVKRLRKKADDREQELAENIDLMSDADVAKNFKDIRDLREKAQDLENKMARRGPSEMDVMPDRMPPEEPEAGMTPEQLRQQRAAEGERSRLMAEQSLREGGVSPEEAEAVTASPVGLTRLNIDNIVDDVLGATRTAEEEAEKVLKGGTEMDALAKDKGVAGRMAKLAETEAKMEAEEAEVVKEDDEFMKRARAGEKSLQTQREELQNSVMKIAGPAAKPEQARTLTELLARARTATTGEEQAELIRQTENVSLPARSIFDAMFGGPQQRARAELIKFFPKPQRQRSASQIEADEALAEQRRASAARTRQLTKLYDPARVSKSKAQTKKILEAAEAREQGYSITESRILRNLRKPKGRRGRSQKADIKASGAAERKEAQNRFIAEDAPLKAQLAKLEAERAILNRQQVGTVPEPGKEPELPKRATRSQKKAYNDALKAWQKRSDKYRTDQAKKTQRNERLGIKGADNKFPKDSVNGQIESLNKARQNAMRRRDKTIKLINDKVAELTGGKTQALRAGAAKRAKAQQKK